MKNGIVLWLILIPVIFIGVSFSVSACNTAVANARDAKANLAWQEGRADALRISAQAGAFAARAAGLALVVASSTPVIAVLAVFGLVLAMIALAVVVTIRTNPVTNTVTREIVLLPDPRQPRRELWKALSQPNIIDITPDKHAIVLAEQEPRNKNLVHVVDEFLEVKGK